jgi:hypothetical protein
MPVFFFNHSSEGKVCVDDIGTEFPSLEAAYLDTCDAVLDIAFEKLRTQRNPEDDSIDIMDVEGHTLMHVPFSEVLRPRRATKLPLLSRNHQAIAACHQEVVRSQALRAELLAELAKTQSALELTRNNLARMRNLAPPQSPP